MLQRVMKTRASRVSSYFEMVFDGNDQYSIPAFPSNDFTIDMDIYLASNGGAGGEQQIFNFLGAGGNSMQLFYYADSPNAFSLETIADFAEIAAPLLQYNRIQIIKAGTTLTLDVDGTQQSFVDAAIVPTSFTTRDLSSTVAGSSIKAGGKIKNMNGPFVWPAALGSALKVYQDVGKTMVVDTTGQVIAVIETPNGDITQSTAANQATATIL